MPRPYTDCLRMRAFRKCWRAKAAGVLRSSSAWPLQLSSNGFSDPRARVGPSEPDRQAPQAEAGGPSGADPEAGQCLFRRSSWRARCRLDLGFLKSRNIARKTLTLVADKRDRAAASVEAPTGQGRPAQTDLHREIWMKTGMSPSYGLSPKGHRVRGSAPFGHRNTANIHRRSAA